MIFIALALGWAVYLIPKALQQHEELARTRSVERFSSRMRIFGGAAPVTNEVGAVAIAGSAPDAVASVPDRASVPELVEGRPLVTRAAARRAAARRRKVLYVLTFLLVVTAVTAGVGYLPIWTPSIPVALIVAFLVIARMTVRREQAARRPQQVAATTAPVAPAAVSEAPTDTEDTIGITRAELAAGQPVADEGSLWDPLPVTLPTYVSKPQARRTVRTIELAQGQITSSGHDPVDSKLVREAEAAKAQQAHDSAPSGGTIEQRRAAGA